MPRRVMHFSVLILAIAFVQSLYAAPLELTEEDNIKSLVLNEAEFNAEPEIKTKQAAPVRHTRDTIVFRPLFATRERDAQRNESRRRMEQAQRERERRKAAKRQ